MRTRHVAVAAYIIDLLARGNAEERTGVTGVLVEVRQGTGSMFFTEDMVLSMRVLVP